MKKVKRNNVVFEMTTKTRQRLLVLVDHKNNSLGVPITFALFFVKYS